MRLHFARFGWTVLLGLALCVPGRAATFKCVDANGKVTYQGEKCATDAKTDAMLHRDGSRASDGEVAAAQAIEADRRKLPKEPRVGPERVPAAKSVAKGSAGERQRNAYELADYCGENAARANACGLDASAYKRSCHSRINALTGNEPDLVEPVVKRMADVSTGPSAKKKFSNAECAAVKAEVDRP